MALKPCRECRMEVSTTATSCPQCGKKNPTRAKMGWGMGCLTLLLISAIGQALIESSNTDTSASSGGGTTTSGVASAPEAPRPDTKESILEAIELDFKWQLGGFDTNMMVDFTITNNSAHTIKDIEVRCRHFAKSGTEIDSNRRTIYELFPKGQKKRVPDFNMGFIHSQAASSSCAITDFVVVDGL